MNSLSGGRALIEKERSFFEPQMGYDFSAVRLHTDSVAAKSAQSINALAYTSGNDIVFNEGQCAPDTDTGKIIRARINACSTAGSFSGQKIIIIIKQ